MLWTTEAGFDGQTGKNLDRFILPFFNSIGQQERFE
jgi:hypothetical protein